MNENKITISVKDARKIYWDALLSNLLFITIALLVAVKSPLWLAILIGFYISSTIFHIFQIKKVLIKGKLFKKKVKKDDGNKGT